MDASPSNESSTGPQPSGSPLVQFARYVDGRLQIFKARTDELDYFAISHVWGKIEWLRVPGIDHEILASKDKAAFIEKKLPGLVGSQAFWMDTITVNQRDKDEVIATVQAIPDIFRDAVKTIAVREGDGFYKCCLEAVEGYSSWADFGNKLGRHAFEHKDDVYQESYLKRLWTLQECFLSHTIQFVNSDDREPKQRPQSDRLEAFTKTDPFACVALLAVLARAFIPPNLPGESQQDWAKDFINAYLFSGTVTREKPARRGWDEDIYSGYFREAQLYSGRSATEPRDYIFATMPQFPWYHYPGNAGQMSFNAIFEDFYCQATRASHRFACRITRSMIEPEPSLTVEQAWFPSAQQPEPCNLGDFMKLLGQGIDCAEDWKNCHVTTSISVTDLNIADLSSTVELVESAMRFSFDNWQHCLLGGELTNYGSCRDGGSRSLRKKRSDLEMLEEKRDPLSNRHLARLREEIAEEEAQESDYDSLEEAQRILSNFFIGGSRHLRKPEMKNDAYLFEQLNLLNNRQPRIMEFIVLLTAMVSCQVPLSAAMWTRQQFIPVRVYYLEFHVIGLLAKHAVGSGISSGQVMTSAGRHFKGESLGKDLAIVDPATKMPVGLLPDFVDQKTTGEKFVERISALYHGAAEQGTPEELIRQRSLLQASKTNAGQQPHSS